MSERKRGELKSDELEVAAWLRALADQRLKYSAQTARRLHVIADYIERLEAVAPQPARLDTPQ